MNSFQLLAGKYTLAINGASFGLFWFDKKRAVEHGWRVPEKSLQLSALLGGWVGGILAMNIFRHKTRKEPFRTQYFSCMALNCFALAIALSRTRGAVLTSSQTTALNSMANSSRSFSTRWRTKSQK